MLNKPSVQKTQQIERLNICGHEVFVAFSLCSRSSSSLVKCCELNLGRMSASGTELEPVLETIETGLELRDDAIELGSDEGKLCRGRCEFLCKFADDVVVLDVAIVLVTAVTGALFGRRCS